LDGRLNPWQVLAAVWTTLQQIQCQDVRGTLDEEAMIFDALNKRVSRGCVWLGWTRSACVKSGGCLHDIRHSARRRPSETRWNAASHPDSTRKPYLATMAARVGCSR
jgi:hypothetical protein